MDLTFQVPMQYCYLQHRILLLSSVTSTAGYCFCFGSIPSFFLELFLHWSPVMYWAPTDLGSSSFSILSFCLLILFMRFSRQEYWSGLPFPSPVDHILSDLSTWPAHLGWPHTAWLSFIELDKAVIHVIRLTSFLWLWFQCICPLMPSRNTYHLTWVCPTFKEGYLLTAAPPDLEHGVATLGCHPWPRTWGSSSRPPALKEINSQYSLEGLMLKLQFFTTCCKERTHWKRLWCWERLMAGGEGNNRGQDGWMASSTQWTWVWASSGRWWRTGKSDVLQSMGLQSWTQLSGWTTTTKSIWDVKSIITSTLFLYTFLL